MRAHAQMEWRKLAQPAQLTLVRNVRRASLGGRSTAKACNVLVSVQILVCGLKQSYSELVCTPFFVVPENACSCNNGVLRI